MEQNVCHNIVRCFSFSSLHFLKTFMCFLSHILYVEKFHSLLAVFFQTDSNAARPMMRDCGHSLAGMASSNPPGTRISLSCDCCVLCGLRLLRVADPSSRGVLQSLCVCVCVYVWACECENVPALM